MLLFFSRAYGRRAAMRRLTIRSFLAGMLGILAILGFLVLSGAGTASADPLVGAGTIAIDAEPTVGGINTSTSIGTIQNCVSIPSGGSTTVEVVVDSIPAVVGPSGGLSGFGMNILYPNAGPGALSVTAKAGPLVALDGKSLLSNNADSTVGSFTNAVPDSDGNFKIVEADGGATYESGAGRLYYLTFTSVGIAGVATLDLTDSSAVTGAGTAGGDDDLIPDVYDGATSAYAIVPANVGDAVVYVGSPCPTISQGSQGFCIVGGSSGASWKWDYGAFNDTLAVAYGSTEIQIANAWVLSMNAKFAGAHTASPLPAPQENCFKITPGTQALIVNNNCTVTTSGCSFNPTIYLMSPVGGVVDMLVGEAGRQGASGSSASYPYAGIAAASLVLGAALWYGRKRWSR
jgi:hypothetical protein